MSNPPVKFLLVDDVPKNLIALDALLRRDDLELLQARSGAEALELLLVHDVSLALVDVQMPEMDGFELAALMRSIDRTRNVPIIFVTAGAQDAQRVFEGYEAGVIDFLFKPIDPHVLRSKAQVFFDLARQRQELTRSLELNELFIAILGHDLRNPLNAITMSASMIAPELTDEVHVRAVRRILRGADRMAEMIEQLLDLTRARLAGRNGFARVRERVDAKDLIRHVLDELQGTYPGREVAVATTGDSAIGGDPPRLLQLLSNLVANALNHGAVGAPIEIGVDGGPRDLVVRVHNGGAIAPDVMPTIFDPFQRRPQKSTGGLGLGLFIARQIALAHGGDLAVASSEAAGTTFTVSLPRAEAAQE